MKKVGAYEAKTHLPRLLEEVKNGESFSISKHGVPVAILKPVENKDTVDVSKVIWQLRKFRKRKTLSEGTIKDLINEGRR